MKPSQRKPQAVVLDSHLTGNSCASLADGISTILDLSTTSSSASDLSTLVGATDVSHALATSYHALTVQILRKNDNIHHSLHQGPAQGHTKHANETSANFEGLDPKLPPHLRVKATQSPGSITPMEYFEEHPLPQYQQLKNCQPFDVHSSYDIARRPACYPSEDNYSVAACFGDQETRDEGLAGSMPDCQRYTHARSHDRDSSEWGQDLSSVGAQFDAHSEGCYPLELLCNVL